MEGIELTVNSTGTNKVAFESANGIYNDHGGTPAFAVEALPDGGYGWTVVFACSVITSMINGWTGSWGVLQIAIFHKYPGQASTTSLKFLGSLSIALCVGVGLACVLLSQLIGARYSTLLGVLIMRFGSLCSSLTVNNLGGLFVTAGISFGLGSSLTYTMSKSFSCWCGRHIYSLRSIFHSTTFRSLDRTASLDRSRYRCKF